MKIRRATIVPGDNFAGIVEHESPIKGLRLDIATSDRTDARIDKAVTICITGPIAQIALARGVQFTIVATSILRLILLYVGTGMLRPRQHT